MVFFRKKPNRPNTKPKPFWVSILRLKKTSLYQRVRAVSCLHKGWLGRKADQNKSSTYTKIYLQLFAWSKLKQWDSHFFSFPDQVEVFTCMTLWGIPFQQQVPSICDAAATHVCSSECTCKSNFFFNNAEGRNWCNHSSFPLEHYYLYTSPERQFCIWRAIRASDSSRGNLCIAENGFMHTSGSENKL